MVPELIADYRCVVGEGPLWHPDEKRVYWLDIPQGRIYRYDPATGTHENCYVGEPVGGMTLQADGSLLLFGDRGSVRVWKEGIVKTILADIPEEKGSRFNDVMADTRGRVYCGTMPVGDRLGRLYRLELDGSVTKLLEGITCSNGLGFAPDLEHLYYTDTMRREIYLFDYDEATGDISNRRVFVTVPEAEAEGLPDGMTVDAEGYVWSARWDGYSMVRYAPDGSEATRVRFPAKKVSCMVFGGDDYTDIYVTTAGGDDKAENGETAGALYRVNLGIRGVPEFRSRVGL